MSKMPKLKSEGPTPYDGFEILNFVDRIRRENLEAKNKGIQEPHPLYKTFIPEEWHKKHSRWFMATEISKCLRRAGYQKLGEVGIPSTLEEERKMEKGINDHFRLEREFRLLAFAKEAHIFDLEFGIYGRCDELSRNYITGELFITEFKTIEEWFFKSRLKREGIRPHLKNTSFYPAIPDDEVQVMLYIRMLRQLIRYPEIPIRFGLIIYENKNNPNERKNCLVEYDEALMAKFLSHLKELNAYLDGGGNISPYIPKEAYVHNICPYRLKCERGQEALLPKLKKRNLPLWKIYDLKRRAKQPMPATLPPPQLKLNMFEMGGEK